MPADRLTELAAVSAVPPVAPPPAFAVSAEVWVAVRRWRTATHLLCGLCGRSIFVVSCMDVPYQYTRQERDGLVLAHLIQSHRWTRESIGDTADT